MGASAHGRLGQGEGAFCEVGRELAWGWWGIFVLGSSGRGDSLVSFFIAWMILLCRGSCPRSFPDAVLASIHTLVLLGGPLL